MTLTEVLTITDAIFRNFSYISFLRDFRRKRISKNQYLSKTVNKNPHMAFYEGGYRGEQK